MTSLRSINALPVPTWRRLGVNGASLELDRPVTSKISQSHLSLPEGVVRTHEGVVKCAEFSSALSGEIAAYVRVHSNTGAMIRVKKGRHADTPVYVRYSVGGNTNTIVDNNVIYAEANSSVTLILEYSENGESAAGENFHAGLTRVIAENCADIRVVEIQTLGAETPHFSDFSAVIANGASVSLTRIELGGGDIFAGSHMKLEGDKAESHAETFYFGDGSRKLDFSYIGRHFGMHSVSRQNAHGVLKDSCDKIFRGTIDFVRGASGSSGAENENTLILSAGIRNRSAPLILSGEENVEGSHASSIGRPDEEKLYYMSSRGLSEQDAIRLLALAELEPSLKNIPDVELRERLRENLAQRID